MTFSTPAIFRRLALAFLLTGGFTTKAAAQSTAPAWQSPVAIEGLNGAVHWESSSAFDGSGNLYIVREFTGTLTLGGATFVSNGGHDVLVLKYAPDGTLSWGRQVGSTGNEGASALALDAQNNVYVTGTFRGNISLGTNISLTWNGQLNGQAYLIRLSAQGTPAWAQQTAEIATGAAVGVDASGQVCWVGSYNAPGLTIGGSFLAGGNTPTVYAARLSAATGSVQVLSTLYSFASTGTGGGSYPLPRLALGTGGEAYVITSFLSPPPVFPNFTPSLRGFTDVVLAKYDAQNRFEWARQIGGTGYESVTDAATDNAGHLYLTGGFDTPCTFDPTTVLQPVGNNDGFLAKYSPQGTLLWARPMGGNGYDTWHSVALEGSGTVYVGGGFSNSVSFGSQTLTGAGPNDAVVASYSVQGQLQWVQQAGGPGFDDVQRLGVGSTGAVSVRGRFGSSCAFGPITLGTAAPSAIFIARLGSGTLAARADKPAGSLSLYPNPAHDLLHLPALPAGTHLQILDALGRVVRETPVTPAAPVSVRGLRPGLYTLRATDAQGRQYAGRVVVE